MQGQGDQGQTGREAFVVLEGTVTVKRNGKKVTKKKLVKAA